MASNSRTCSKHLLLSISLILLSCSMKSCYGLGTFGFDIHHRFSDHVKGFMPVGDLPEKGSPEYYEVLVHRDRFLHARRLLDAPTELSFLDGNNTQQYISLGFLHYANVSVGTPSVSFLVALDTGSDLFWLPCDCTSCLRSLTRSNGEVIKLNIYSPNASSTSSSVPCSSPLCPSRSQCSSSLDTCPYKASYLSYNTSSTGFLVEDLLHLETDVGVRTPVDAPVTLGCGKVLTGSFLEGAAPNGLFGLGIEGISVPSILAAKGLTSNSFSMCFGDDGVGTITFGDNGKLGQGETPFNLEALHPTYNVSTTQIIVGSNTTNHNFSAIFDTGTSFTYLTKPTYTIFTENFNSQVQEKRHLLNLSIPFEFCYDIGASQTTLKLPEISLTMKGGASYTVFDTVVVFSLRGGNLIYCLSILESGDINIIGQNFMTGYSIVFDREKNILGWKEEACIHGVKSNITSVTPTVPPTPAPASSPKSAQSPTNAFNKTGSPPPSSNNSARLSRLFAVISTMIFPFLAFV